MICRPLILAGILLYGASKKQVLQNISIIVLAVATLQIKLGIVYIIVYILLNWILGLGMISGQVEIR